MASGKRYDPQGEVLQTGESYRQTDSLYVYRYTDHSGRHAVYAPTLEQLREKETEIRKKLESGIEFYEASKTTLEQIFLKDLGLRTAEGTLKKPTGLNYKRMWDSNLKDFGKKTIASIDSISIRELLAAWNTQGLSHSTVKLLLGLISHSFDIAQEMKLITTNPAKAVSVKKALKANKRKDVKEGLTAKQQERLLAFVRESHRWKAYDPYLTLCFRCGLRVGEITGLTLSRIDTQNRIITIDRQLRYQRPEEGQGYQYFWESPKTEAGIREIPYDDEVAQAITEQLHNIEQSGRICKHPVEDVTDFLFLNNRGKPLSTAIVTSFLKNIVNAYNRENPEAEPLPYMGTHILRHTFGTRAIESGVNPKALQKVMGHSDIQITLNTYVSTNDQEWIKKEMAKLSQTGGKQNENNDCQG